MTTLRQWWWEFFGVQRLERKLDALTLPQLNLLEARMRDAGCWGPQFESLFTELRQEKTP